MPDMTGKLLDRYWSLVIGTFDCCSS